MENKKESSRQHEERSLANAENVGLDSVSLTPPEFGYNVDNLEPINNANQRLINKNGRSVESSTEQISQPENKQSTNQVEEEKEPTNIEEGKSISSSGDVPNEGGDDKNGENNGSNTDENKDEDKSSENKNEEGDEHEKEKNKKSVGDRKEKNVGEAKSDVDAKNSLGNEGTKTNSSKNTGIKSNSNLNRQNGAKSKNKGIGAIKLGDFGEGKEPALYFVSNDVAQNISGTSVIVEENSKGKIVKLGPDFNINQIGESGKKQHSEFKKITKGEANQIFSKKRLNAKELIKNFVSSASSKTDALRAKQNNISANLNSHSNTAQLKLDKSVSNAIENIKGSFQDSKLKAKADAKSAKQKLSQDFRKQLENINSSKTSAITTINTKYETVFDKIVEIEKSAKENIESEFTSAQSDTRQVGVDKGNDAIGMANAMAEEYKNEALPEMGRLESLAKGGDYYKNKRNARVSAAMQVGEEHKKQFIQTANDAANTIAEGKAEVIKGALEKIAEAKSKIKEKKKSALKSIKTSWKNDTSKLRKAYKKDKEAIANQLNAQLDSLSQLESSQVQNVQSSGAAMKPKLAESGRKAVMAFNKQISGSIAKIENSISEISQKASSQKTPNIEAIRKLLADNLVQISQSVEKINATTDSAGSSAINGINTQSSAFVTNIQETATEAIGLATSSANDFKKSTNEISKSSKKAYAKIAKGFKDKIKKETTSFDKDITKIESDTVAGFENVKTKLNEHLSKAATDLGKDFDLQLDKLPDLVKTKAQEAADKVQPRWKSVLKVVIAIVIAIVVTALIIVTMGSALTLLPTIGLVFLIGGTGAVAKQLIYDGLDGELSSFGTYATEFLAGGVGGLFTLAGAGLGGLASKALIARFGGEALSRGSQIVIAYSSEVVIGTTIDSFGSGVADTLNRLANGQEVSLGTFGQAMQDQFLINVAGNFGGKALGDYLSGFGRGARETTEQVVRETTEESIEQASKETVEQTTREVAEEVTEETVEQTAKEATEEATEETVEQTAKEATEEVAEETVEQTAKEATEEVAEETVEQTTKEATEEVAEETVEQTAKEATEEVAEETVEQTTKEATEETIDQSTKELAEEASSGFPKEAPNGYEWVNGKNGPYIRRTRGNGPTNTDPNARLPKIRYDKDIDDFITVKDSKSSLSESAEQARLNPLEDVHAGVREASSLLREMNVPRGYRKQIIDSFEEGSIIVKTADDATFGIRFHGGGAKELGRYLFPTFTNSTNRVGLALPAKWNSMENITQFKIESGTKIIYGRAASQGGRFTGGSPQIYVNDLKRLNKLNE